MVVDRSIRGRGFESVNKPLIPILTLFLRTLPMWLGHAVFPLFKFLPRGNRALPRGT
jgi:hypothetical protein